MCNSEFKVKVSRESVFHEIQSHTKLHTVHLVLVDITESLTWDTFIQDGCFYGSLIDLAEANMVAIIKTFFDEVSTEKFAWRYVLNSTRAASLDLVHLHIYIADKELFGAQGLIKRAVDSIKK